MKIITITLHVPDDVQVQVQKEASLPLADAVEHLEASRWLPGACPKHGPDKWGPSKFGGHYCSAPDEAGPKGFCILKSGMEYQGRIIP